VWFNDGVFVSSQKNVKDMERAQAAFHKKEIQAREGAVAMAEYKAAAKPAAKGKAKKPK
jgi:hypothetical protein